jgi:tRNA pseudouridine13 synthase
MLRLSKNSQASGVIKSKPEDFRVEEITATGHVLEIGKSYSPETLGLTQGEEGKFSIFVMQKTDWNTAQALKALARKFRKGIKSTSFAGTKDRTSVSTQLCGIFGVKPEELSRIHIKDITINGAWIGKDKIKMGDLLGNRFGITVREVQNQENIPKIIEELNGVFPNYFGEQRFGNRKTNVEIGTHMLKGDFKEAAFNFLTQTQNELNEDAKFAREKLTENMDFKEALQYFPEYLKYERMMLEYLSRYPDNYANAIRKLPRSISLMFIHSVEAYIFNRELEERIKQERFLPEQNELVCSENFYGFPDTAKIEQFAQNGDGKLFLVGNMLGYDTVSVTDLEKEILDELGLTVESFKVKGLNELGSKGTYRTMFAPFKDFSYTVDEENNASLSFSLPSGSYATTFLEELLAK